MAWRASAFALALAYLLSLVYSGLATALVQDPMEAHAQSFGWLAIRNFTYCLSRAPDPPNKPLGIQPEGTSFSTSDRRKPRTTGMGDSVVVLYHPEQPEQPIAWCNTLVAFTSTEHMKCHTALPTCQRCDAVRSGQQGGSDKSQNGQPAPAAAPAGGQPAQTGPQPGAQPAQAAPQPGAQPAPASPPAGGQPQGQNAGQGKDQGQGPNAANQPSSDQGVPRRKLDPPAPGTPQDDSGLVSLAKRDTPSSPPSQNSPPSDKTARPFGTTSSSTIQDYLADATLQDAIHEFQDFCENKLTLAVRADCPLHIVKGWRDEPPFDLHRFCSTMQGSKWVHYGPQHPNTGASTQAKDDGGKGSTKPPAPVTGEDRGKNIQTHYARGSFDPNDPIVPWPGDSYP